MTDADAAAPIIRLARVAHAYDRHQALADLSFEIAKNEWVFITGPSGAGKSTLLKLLYFGTRASAGEVFIDGENPARLPPRRVALLRRKCGVIFQDYKLIPGRSVFANVALVLEASGHRRRLIPQKVRSVLRLVGMESHAAALPPRLSGGEQQRVAVARAIVGDPKLILADEPTGSLDEVSARGVMDLLRAAYIRGATVVIATHDQRLIGEIGGRVLMLDRGRLTRSVQVDKHYDRRAF
ncbi:MAG: ATP-binding cassette domain-containing protein [Desulfobacteraceae bacterium]|nr:MAG: ATP-binding cassette domain-containing protein [Desulfobacteraceae bacterium]